MPDWLRRPVAFLSAERARLVGAGLLALIVGYVGGTWLIDSTPPSAVAAADAVPVSVDVDSERGPIVIHGTGDVLLDPRHLGALAEGFNAPWSGVRDLFTRDDLTVVNLECSPGDGGIAEDKEFTFRCARGFSAMRANGVDVANLGNNHAGDYGKDALVSGVDALRGADVAPVGAGRNVDEANAAALFELKGRTVAVLGFGGVVPTPAWFATADRPGVSDGYDTASMVRAVKAASARADIVVVSVHWGAELDTEPRSDDVERAHAMIEAGADAIFGHHAHVLQPLRFYRERPIFFGLGNFVWPKGGPTAVAQVTIAEDGKISGCLLPATINGGRPSLGGPRSCSG